MALAGGSYTRDAQKEQDHQIDVQPLAQGRCVVPRRRVPGLPFRAGAAARNGKPSALRLPTPLREETMERPWLAARSLT